MSVICNHDCFNCQYPDCMNDDITLEEYREITKRDAEIKWQNNPLTDVERQKRLNMKGRYEADKERLCAYNKGRYKVNKERIKAYREANIEHVRTYGKAWREANPGYKKAWNEANQEHRRLHQKAYRKAKKLAQAANQNISTATRQVQHGI